MLVSLFLLLFDVHFIHSGVRFFCHVQDLFISSLFSHPAHPSITFSMNLHLIYIVRCAEWFQTYGRVRFDMANILNYWHTELSFRIQHHCEGEKIVEEAVDEELRTNHDPSARRQQANHMPRILVFRRPCQPIRRCPSYCQSWLVCFCLAA